MLGLSYARCMVIHKQKESSSQRQFHSVHYSFWIHLLVRFIMNTSVSGGGGSLITTIFCFHFQLLLIWWWSFDLFWSSFASRATFAAASSRSRKLHLQMFSCHIEELSFMKQVAFRHANEGWHFYYPEVWYSAIGNIQAQSEKSFM